MLDFINTITPEIVGDELRRAKVMPSQRGMYFEILPRSLNRRDYHQRVQIRVHGKGRPLYFLTVGPNLSDLWKRSRAFSAACPSISCQPIFRHQAGDLDYVALDFFDGVDMETAVLHQGLPLDEAMSKARIVVTALERTFESSSVESAARELDRLFAQVMVSPMFSGLDQCFLKDVVFPFIRVGALRGPFRSRWTNGDLVPRNVLFNSGGEVRLIDYEFAHRTNFSGDDWWRWHTFNALPEGGHDLPAPSGNHERAGWMEALFILRHMILALETNGAQIALADASHWSERLLTLVSQANHRFRGSLFWGSAVQPEQPKLPTASAPQLQEGKVNRSKFSAQLFFRYGDQPEFEEARSQFVDCPAEKAATLIFRLPPPPAGAVQLRLDPVDAIGILKISRLIVRAGDTGTALLSFPDANPWREVFISPTALPLSGGPELKLVSLTDDPNFTLPILDWSAAGQNLICEVALEFSPDLLALPALLSHPSKAEVDVAADCASLAQHLQDANAELATARVRIEGSEGLSDSRAAEIATLRADLAARTAEVSTLSSRLSEMQVHFDALADRHRNAENLAQAKATECASLAQHLHDANAALANTRIRFDLSQGALDSRAAEVAALRADLATRTTEVSALSARLAEMQGQFNAVGERQRHAESLIQSKSAECAALAQNLQDANAALATARARFETSEGLLESRSSEIAALRADLAACTTEVATLSTRLNEMQVQCDAVGELQRKAESLAQAKDVECTALSQHLQDAKAALATAEATLNDLKKLEQNASDDRSRLELSLSTLQARHRLAIEDLYAQNEALDDYATRSRLAEQEFSLICKRAAAADQKMIELQTQVSIAESGIQIFQAALARTESQLVAIKTEYGNALVREEARIAAVLREKADVEIKLTELTGRQVEISSQLERVVEEASTHRNEGARLAARLEKSETELNGLRSRPLVRLDARMRRLKRLEDEEPPRPST